jgi:hypothetical protein
MLDKTERQDLLTPSEMVEMLVDWTGGCPSCPGNTDVVEVLMSVGVRPERLAQMANLLATAEWSRYAIGKLIVEVTSSPRVLAALVRHGNRYHGLRMDEARRDLRELRGEAREIVQREVLKSVGGRGNGRHHP